MEEKPKRVVPVQPQKKPKASAKSKVASVKKATTASPSAKLLVGEWKGDKATPFTRYLDFTFKHNGEGNRDNQSFRWELVSKDNKEHLKISWIRPIDKGEYNNIRSNADEMMPEGENVTTYITKGKKERVVTERGQYFLVTGMELFKIAVLNNKKLVLSAKSTKGKTINTYHIKQ